jgi:hypothetical protein
MTFYEEHDARFSLPLKSEKSEFAMCDCFRSDRSDLVKFGVVFG